MALSQLCKQWLSPTNVFMNQTSNFHLSAVCNFIWKRTRLRCVDNSEIGRQAMAEGKPPRVFHIYSKRKHGYIGDRVMCAVKGQKIKGIIVGLKANQKPKIPRFDSNNVVLIDDNGTPLGTRIHVPIPTVLRTILKNKTYSKGADYTKMLAVASKFI